MWQDKRSLPIRPLPFSPALIRTLVLQAPGNRSYCARLRSCGSEPFRRKSQNYPEALCPANT